MNADGYRAEDWQPGLPLAIVWNALAVTLSLAGVIILSIVYAPTHGGKGGGEIGILAMLATIAIFFCLLDVHE